MLKQEVERFVALAQASATQQDWYTHEDATCFCTRSALLQYAAEAQDSFVAADWEAYTVQELLQDWEDDVGSIFAFCAQQQR